MSDALRTADSYSIGEVAARANVSTRTLRYYEQLGLVSPSGYTTGGFRRYADADVHRVLRIRELQSLLGFNLDDIGTILGVEDRLDAMRARYESADAAGRLDVLREAWELNARLQDQARAKVAVLERYLSELEAKAARYRELEIELEGPTRSRRHAAATS